MTLDEAIQHLREMLTDPAHEWGCEECRTEHEQLLAWLEDYKRLQSTRDAENSELKRLLRLAVRDIGKMQSCNAFPFCVGCPKENEPYCGWKYNDEAMKLLDGDANEQV